jgi:hypothetical protein
MHSKTESWLHEYVTTPDLYIIISKGGIYCDPVPQPTIRICASGWSLALDVNE